ncbi:hypothetical protein GJ634_04215 [Halobacterium sp. CBA1126]|nr:hypothetical protein [Halobacterium sp. CBA1126]
MFFGFGAAWNAREVARKDEQYDAIGSQRDWAAAQPAGWKVKTTRLLWGAIGLVGLAAFVGGFVL